MLDALERSKFKSNTIIVFWSDHGWHLGEKNHWHKMTMWEEATRVPLIIVAPGVTNGGMVCTRPVDTLSVFPTLIELCGPKPKLDLDGHSIVPLLKNPELEWEVPAITEFQRGQSAVRSQRFRYIRYSDGSEELYDHASDPNEWTNLAQQTKYQSVIADHARWVQKEMAPGAPSKQAYRFDPAAFTWKHKETGKITHGRKLQVAP